LNSNQAFVSLPRDVQGKLGKGTGSHQEGDRAPSLPPSVGKRTLIAQLEGSGPSPSEVSRVDLARGLPRLQLKDIPARSAAVQRKPGSPGTGVGGAEPGITPPKSGIDKAGFIDNSDGANLRTGPIESGGQKVRDQPLPPAPRVFVSGTHPDAPE